MVSSIVHPSSPSIQTKGRPEFCPKCQLEADIRATLVLLIQGLCY